jgi:acyl-coenzyme A synthetase/AMP-(fatty) acid ligase
MASPFEEEIRLGSCGKPLKVYDVRIFDDHDIECGPRVTGEIVVRGREPYGQMDGYYNMPEATVRASRNLWFHTGDFAYKDEDGYFYFVDRKKDALRKGGENISSFEVEQVINSHPKVFESAVLAVPSELSEDDVKAVVVLKDGEKITPEELILCNDRWLISQSPVFGIQGEFTKPHRGLRSTAEGGVTRRPGTEKRDINSKGERGKDQNVKRDSSCRIEERR